MSEVTAALSDLLETTQSLNVTKTECVSLSGKSVSVIESVDSTELSPPRETCYSPGHYVNTAEQSRNVLPLHCQVPTVIVRFICA